jgi:hypothetical protein
MPVQTQMQVRRGTASSWTSTNPTLAAGELGFETDTGKFKIGTGALTWTSLSYAGGGQNTLTTYQYTATAGQTTFSGVDANGNTLSYTAGAVQVYLNGALLANTTDYAASTGTSVVLTGGAGLGDSLTILSLGSFTVSTDIPKSTLTAKGSIVAASGAATPANLSVGANDTVLTADSTTATGLKWATPAAPATGANWSLLNAGGTTLSGAATITVSGISGKDKIMILIKGASANAGSFISYRFNADSGANYTIASADLNAASSYAASNFGSGFSTAATAISMAIQSSDASASCNGYLLISGCNSSGTKIFNGYGGGGARTGNNQYFFSVGGSYNSSSTISSVSILTDTGSFDDTDGRIFVYTSA